MGNLYRWWLLVLVGVVLAGNFAGLRPHDHTTETACPVCHTLAGRRSSPQNGESGRGPAASGGEPPNPAWVEWEAVVVSVAPRFPVSLVSCPQRSPLLKWAPPSVNRRFSPDSPRAPPASS